VRVQLGFNGDPPYSPRCYATLRTFNRRMELALACGASSSSPPFCGVRRVFKGALNSGEVTLPWALLRPPRGATGLWRLCGAVAGRGVAATRRHRRRAPAVAEVFPSNTCASGHRGEDKGNREGRRVARVRACVPGPAGVRARSGGPYRRRPLSGGAATVWSALCQSKNTEELWKMRELWCSD
jgi:hypothetical protein